MGFLSIIGTGIGAYFGGPAGASIGGALGGAIEGSRANKSAENSVNASNAAAIAEQRRQFDLTRSDYAPYRKAGVNALTSLQTDIKRLPSAREVMTDPGYQFGLAQGMQALDRGFAAAGGRVSGAALKAATRYGTDYAKTGYNAAYQRRQDRLNRLAALAGVGQTATGGSAIAGQAAAGNISNLYQQQGENAAAGTLGRSSIWGNAGNQISALLGGTSFGGGWNSGGASFGPQLDGFFGGTLGSGD